MKRSLYLSDDDIMNVQDRVVSYGGGTQSTAMILMALEGDLDECPDFGIFADTQREPEHVMEYVYMFTEYCKKTFGFDILITTQGDLGGDVLHATNILKKTGQELRTASLPYFTKNPETATKGMVMRQCTLNYKIRPMHKMLKRELDIAKGRYPERGCEIWMGISFDERERMKTSQDWYSILRYPLVEAEVHRQQSIDYVVRHGLPEPPRSSCYFCPFHHNDYWRFLRDNHPQEWEKAQAFDHEIRRMPKMRNDCFLHEDLVPLSEVDISSDEERGQTNMFMSECEGFCGT